MGPTLFDELVELGFGRSYQTLTRELRAHRSAAGVRGVPCRDRAGPCGDRPSAGEETQWDWLELPDPPASWGWGKAAHLLVGSLAHSGKWRALLAPSQDQPHLVAGLDTRQPRAWAG